MNSLKHLQYLPFALIVLSVAVLAGCEKKARFEMPQSIFFYTSMDTSIYPYFILFIDDSVVGKLPYTGSFESCDEPTATLVHFESGDYNYEVYNPVGVLKMSGQIHVEKRQNPLYLISPTLGEVSSSYICNRKCYCSIIELYYN